MVFPLHQTPRKRKTKHSENPPIESHVGWVMDSREHHARSRNPSTGSVPLANSQSVKPNSSQKIQATSVMGIASFLLPPKIGCSQESHHGIIDEIVYLWLRKRWFWPQRHIRSHWAMLQVCEMIVYVDCSWWNRKSSAMLTCICVHLFIKCHFNLDCLWSMTFHESLTFYML